MDIQQKIRNKSTFFHCGKDYRDSTLSKLFPTASEIMQSLKLIGQFKLSKLAVNAFRQGRMDGPTITMEKLCFL